MLRQVEASKAVADAVALCRPEVICAYPITPQTHIVEALGSLVKSGDLSGCRFINVESEFAALSVAIGASATGARAYTATASQGLLFMAEAVYNASGMGLPIVMTIANRAIGAPINIWNDQSDSMAMRDAGWVQLHAPSNQEAVDIHIQAFRIAEELSVPVMVCMDGFVLTHAVERIDVPTQAQIDEFLPPFAPRQWLDVEHPISMGAMVGPEAFTEVRYLQHADQMHALTVVPRVAAQFEKIVGRRAGGLVTPYRTDDAGTIVVALGSAVGTLQDVVDELRDEGARVGVLSIGCYRPFPAQAVRDALAAATRVVVIERAFNTGDRGPLSTDVQMALTAAGMHVPVETVVAGLGGRPVTKATLRNALLGSGPHPLDGMTFIDMDHEVVRREQARRSGSMAAATPVPHRNGHKPAGAKG